MARYKVQNMYIKHGIVEHAEDKVEEAIQPVLDDGSKNGWTLHSFQATTAPLGTHLVFIWILPD